MGNWITQKEAAALYGVTRANISYHVKAGNLQSKQYGRYVMVNKEEVERLAARTLPRGVKRSKKKRSTNGFSGHVQAAEARRSGDGSGN